MKFTRENIKQKRADYSKILDEIKANNKKNPNIKKDSIIVSINDGIVPLNNKDEQLQNQEAQ